MKVAMIELKEAIRDIRESSNHTNIVIVKSLIAIEETGLVARSTYSLAKRLS